MLSLGANSAKGYPILDSHLGMIEESLIHWATLHKFKTVVKYILDHDDRSIIYLRNLQTPLDYCKELLYLHDDPDGVL